MSSNKQSLKQTILSQDMNRKDFLVYAGATLVAISGIGSLSKALTLNKKSIGGGNKNSYGGK